MKTAHLLKTPRSIPRAQESDVADFNAAPVGNIADALGRSGAMDYRIKAITVANQFCGSALTVDAGPRDNLAPWAALKLAKPGDVLVISTGGHTSHSVCGDLLIGMAANAGVVAVVTDGVVRDVTGANAVGIPVFAMGVSPNSPQKKGPGSVGFPLVVSGVSVRPGDIVRGDEDGVVVIPATKIAATRASLDLVFDKEATMEAAVKAGAVAPDWVADQSLEDLFTVVD